MISIILHILTVMLDIKYLSFYYKKYNTLIILNKLHANSIRFIKFLSKLILLTKNQSFLKEF